MPDEDEQTKERSKVTLRIGEVQVELEGTNANIKKLMNKELYDFARGLEGTSKQVPPPSNEIPPKITPKTPEIAPKEKTVPPPTKPSTTTPEPPPQPQRVPTMGKKPEKTGKRKIAWRTVAIALVLVGIVLSAALVSVIAIYLPMVNDLQSQAADKDANIAALTSQVASLNTQISSLQASLDQNNATILNLQNGIQILNSQIQGYVNLLFLNVSSYLLLGEPVPQQNASEATIIYQNALDYAGYVGVSAEAASNTTYIELSYSAYGVNFDQNVTVGTAGTAYFPVLPSTIGIIIGNTDTDGYNNNATVTAVYYY